MGSQMNIVRMLILLLWCAQANAAMNLTHIILTNNTSKLLTVNVVASADDPEFKKGVQWDADISTLKPYETKKVLWFIRNSGLKVNHRYDFNLILNQSIKFHFNLIPNSTFGSVISTDLTMPDFPNQIILSQNGLYHYPNIHARTWRPSSQLFNDYQFVIDDEKPVSIQTEHSAELSVLTYNTQMMPFYADGIDDLNDPSIRERNIPDLISGFDVVMMEELFDRDLRSAMIKDMSRYYSYHTSVVGANTNRPLTGGVMIFSKWPILEEDQMVYTDSSGIDKLAAKGVGYAVINKQGQRYHLFATHPVAGNSLAVQQARSDEFKQFEEYIQSKNIPINEPVILGGDFNVNQKNSEFKSLKASLQLELPQNNGYVYSFDGLTNTMNNTKERSRLDYVFYSKQHLQPSASYNKVFILREFNEEAKWPKFDLSDHYPVVAYFNYS